MPGIPTTSKQAPGLKRQTLTSQECLEAGWRRAAA